MTEFFEIFMQQASIWGPAIVACLGIITTVVCGLNKLISALGESKQAVQDLKDTQAFKDLTAENKQLASRVDKLTSILKIIVDKNMHIEGYCDLKEQEND